MRSVKFPVYYYGRPSEHMSALKNAALYAEKIFAPRTTYIRDRIKESGESYVDSYSIYAVVRQAAFEEYDRCVEALEEAEILEFDEKAGSDGRASICGKIFDCDMENKKLRDDLVELSCESEEMRTFRDIHEALGDRIKEIDLPWAMTEFLISHDWAFSNAIIGSVEYSAYPLTDDPLFQEMLKVKAKHLSRMKNIAGRSKDPLMIETALANAHRQMIASEAFNLCVPYFYRIPIDQIIKIRQNEKQALENLSREFLKLNSLIESSKWNEELNNKIKKTVNDEIRKRVIDIQEAMRNAYYDTVKKVGEAEIVVATAGLAGLVFQGMPSFLAVLGASSLYALKSIWSYFVEKEKIRENSVYYVFKVSELENRYANS